MPITVRYGDTGDLGALAVQTGKGQDFWRRFQAEQNLVNAVRQDYRQQDALRLEAQRLQQAAQMQRQLASQAPTSRRATLVGSPLAQTIQGTPKSSIAGQFRNLNLSPAESDALELAVQMGDRDTFQRIMERALYSPTQGGAGGTGTISGGGTEFQAAGGEIQGTRTFVDATGQTQVQPIPQEEIQQRGGFVSAQPQQGQDPRATQKLAYLQQLQVSDSDRAALMVAVQDPSIDLSAFMDDARLIQRGERETPDGLTTYQQVRQQERFTDNQIRDIDRRIDQLKEDNTTGWMLIVSDPYEALSEADQQVKSEYQQLLVKRRQLREQQGNVANLVRQQQQPSTSPLAAGGTPVVRTKVQYDQLAPGAAYIDSRTGEKMVKGGG